MVNNSLETSENEKEPVSSTDDNNSNGNGQVLSGCSSNDDGNPPQKYYARRRKCNENVQVCEKQKKRESYQRVSRIYRNQCRPVYRFCMEIHYALLSTSQANLKHVEFNVN